MSEFFSSIKNWLDQYSQIINIILAIYALKISREKTKLKKEADISRTLEIVKEALKKVPNALDPTNLPIVEEKIEPLEEKFNLLENKNLTNAEMYIKLGNIEYVHGNLTKALDYYKKVLEDEEVN